MTKIYAAIAMILAGCLPAPQQGVKGPKPPISVGGRKCLDPALKCRPGSMGAFAQKPGRRLPLGWRQRILEDAKKAAKADMIKERRRQLERHAQ